MQEINVHKSLPFLVQREYALLRKVDLPEARALDLPDMPGDLQVTRLDAEPRQHPTTFEVRGYLTSPMTALPEHRSLRRWRRRPRLR